MVGLRRFVWHGDTTLHERASFLKEPAELLMTTPESLEVMLVSRRVDEAELFRDLRMVIVDEVHSFAGEDRGAHLMSVLERLARLSSHDVQRAGLSATVGNPEAILAWLQGTSQRPGEVIDPPKQPARREILVVHRPDQQTLAREASRMAKGQKSLFFCQSRATTEAVAEHMRRAGTNVFVHHSAVSREERALAEERFHHGSDACIVCTSTLELGIDVGDLDRVLQAEAPTTVSSFLQRMGRTGRRAGQTANTTFFCEHGEGVLQAIALVELAKSGWVESVETGGRCWPVLIHQLLALSLAEDGIAPEDAWTRLHPVADFRDIHRAEYERLIQWMLRDRAFELASGRLLLGPTAERRFGRRNFMELFAVFSSAKTYTVQDQNGQPIGSLEQAFVDRLVDDVSTFLLGGRPWAVLRVQHDDRRVLVTPAPKGREPVWGGYLPLFLGLEVCQRVLVALVSDEEIAYLEESAREVLEEQRSAMRPVLSEDGGVELVDGDVYWWTFAGGRINGTLRYALRAAGGEGWKIVPDNYRLRIRGTEDAPLDVTRFSEAVRRLQSLELWEDPDLWAGVAQDLPNYRLSKFQPLMPPWVEREVIAGHLLDVAGAWRWLSGERAITLQRVPPGIAERLRADGLALLQQAAATLPLLERDPERAIVWVRSEGELQDAVRQLASEACIGVDVETTLASRTLCLLQIAAAQRTFLVDPFEVADLSPLEKILASEAPTKLIHNAAFEREVLGRVGLELRGVVDTMEESRRRRGEDAEGGHSLQKVCERELARFLSKRQQTSNWARRPLSERQVAYAALDAELLLLLSVVPG
jgi:ATP-dependent helicase Lhr and Lhr-like helicase